MLGEVSWLHDVRSFVVTLTFLQLQHSNMTRLHFKSLVYDLTSQQVHHKVQSEVLTDYSGVNMILHVEIVQAVCNLLDKEI